MVNELNYLGISPSQRIADALQKEFPDFTDTTKILTTVNNFIDAMEEENVRYHENKRKEKNDKDMTAGETYRFLRSQERVKNTKHLLQYLVTFVTDLPLEKDIIGKPVNPFMQLRNFTINSIELLKEKDVETAILKEHQRLGLLNETNAWYYRGQVDKSYKTILKEVEGLTHATVPGYCRIFQALLNLCTFWFSVRNQEINRVRKSDLMVYKLTRALLARHCGRKTSD